MNDTSSVLIVGVGGQGVILAGTVLASVCLSQGLVVKKSDVHGMAQRGGVVYSHVRFGPAVSSPMIEEGTADALVALEWAEALRWVSYLRSGGAAIVDAVQIVPPVACADRRGWTSSYPAPDPHRLRDAGCDVYLADARSLAKSAGVAKAANIVLLGALSTRLPFPPSAWEDAIRRSVPSGSADANMKAFHLGQDVRPMSEMPAVSPVSRRPRDARDAVRFAVDVIDAWCKGCDICVRVCPEDCLRLNDAGIVRLVDPGTCTGCRLCEWLCPDFAISITPAEVAARG